MLREYLFGNEFFSLCSQFTGLFEQELGEIASLLLDIDSQVLVKFVLAFSILITSQHPRPSRECVCMKLGRKVTLFAEEQ
jgi:hypothetical protein